MSADVLMFELWLEFLMFSYYAVKSIPQYRMEVDSAQTHFISTRLHFTNMVRYTKLSLSVSKVMEACRSVMQA